VRQILVLSGKGGTGKTSLTAAFAHLASPLVLADCDVDAADLWLVVGPGAGSAGDATRGEPFDCGYVVEMDADLCIGCGACLAYCRFDAVRMVPSGDETRPRFDPLACEGCGVCVDACPVGALSLKVRHAGEMFVTDSRFGPMVHAALWPGQPNSGKLVSQVRSRSAEIARRDGHGLVLVDGPPGVGCPVIAAMAGVDAAVIVTEPTISAVHDMERAVGLCRHFSVPPAVVVNKADINEDISAGLAGYCWREGIPLLGRIDFDERFVRAVLARKAVTEMGDSPPARQVRRAWQRLGAIGH
jgi:MinD superfamily P-loop ATPase